MIFLSHASADKPLVRFIGQELEACGHSFWMDEREMGVGQPLTATLTSAIESSSALLVFLSPLALRSDWVRREIDIARSRRNTSPAFIPCLLDQVRLEDLPSDVRDMLCVDLRDPARHAVEMARLLIALAGDDDDKQRILPPLDGHRSAELCRRATHMNIQFRVLDWLVATVADLSDATERYWAYLTVGHLGDSARLPFLDDAVTREDGFAKRGAQRGRELLVERNRLDLTVGRRGS